MAGLHWVAVAVGCACVLGCPAADDSSDDIGGSETTGSSGNTTTESTSASTTTASTSVSTSATSTSTTDPTMGEVTSTTLTTDTDTGAGACDSCNAGDYCDWSVNSCGAEPYDEGMCTMIPDGCPAVEEDPVCGCDGVVYSGTCAAALLGVDVDTSGQCNTPPGHFQCGYKFCDPTTSYCQWSVSDVGGEPDGWGCVALPGSCGDAPTCECLADQACGFDCAATRDGGLLLTCPGG